jgi:hypothetical protein
MLVPPRRGCPLTRDHQFRALATASKLSRLQKTIDVMGRWKKYDDRSLIAPLGQFSEVVSDACRDL